MGFGLDNGLIAGAASGTKAWSNATGTDARSGVCSCPPSEIEPPCPKQTQANGLVVPPDNPPTDQRGRFWIQNDNTGISELFRAKRLLFVSGTWINTMNDSHSSIEVEYACWLETFYFLFFYSIRFT
jgi:hypothetical protein